MDRTLRGVEGVGGEAQARLTTAKTFTIGGQTFTDVPFFVMGNDLEGSAVGLLGQNLFLAADVEYDLANGAIRLMRPHDCKTASLAYWAQANPQTVSVIDILFASPEEPHTAGSAYLNGNKIRVIFDTGAGPSMLSLEAAKRAGITPGSQGVIAGGETGGIGSRTVKTWIATFQSFRIGRRKFATPGCAWANSTCPTSTC